MKLRSLSFSYSGNESEISRAFNITTWCASYHLLSKLRSPEVENFNKIVVRFSDKEVAYFNIQQLLNVVLITVPFDFSQYSSLREYEKKQQVLEAASEGINHIFRKYGLDTSLLKNAYDECFKDNLEYDFLVKNQFKISPSRKHYGGVICSWRTDSFTANAIFQNLDKQIIAKKNLFWIEPHLVETFGKVYWEDSNTLTLISKDGRQRWSAKI